MEINLNHVPAAIRSQVAAAAGILKNHLTETLNSLHLYGSALQGGLKPLSDIDLLVTVTAPLTETQRAELMTELLSVSAWPGTNPELRALEITILDISSVKPWRYPARRELQFGEWLRQDILNGIYEPAMTDPDLAILLTKARMHNMPLLNGDAATVFDAVPQTDLKRAFSATLAQWNTSEDWENEECNIILALSRIAYTLTTGHIASKADAAAWLAESVTDPQQQQLLLAARHTYLTGESFRVSDKKAISHCILSLRALCEGKQS